MSQTAETPDDMVGFFETPTVVALPPRLEMRTVAETAETIRAASGPLTLKADRVELVTSPGVQLLLATIRSGREVTIDAPSAAFLDCIALLGVTPERLSSRGETA